MAETAFVPLDPLGLLKASGYKPPAPQPAWPVVERAPVATEADQQTAEAARIAEEGNKAEPGRYELVPQGSAAKWQEEWQKSQPSQFMKGLKGALVDQNPELLGSALDAIGVISGAQKLRDLGSNLEKYGKQNSYQRQARVGSVADIRYADGIGSLMSDVADYAAYSLGSGLGSMAPSVAVGVGAGAVTSNPVVGFVAGAAGPSYVQNLGDVYKSMREDPGIKARMQSGELSEQTVAKWATGAAVPMAALDALSLGKLMGIGTAPIKGSIVQRIKKGLVEGALTEGSTEGLQEIISLAVQEHLGSNKTRAEQAISVIDNAIGGILAGGAVGGAAGAMQRQKTEAGPGNEQPGATPPGPDAAAQAPPDAPLSPQPAPAAQETPKGPLKSAMEYGIQKANERDTGAPPASLPGAGEPVVVTMDNGGTFQASVQSYSNGEALVSDAQTGELLQVPVASLRTPTPQQFAKATVSGMEAAQAAPAPAPPMEMRSEPTAGKVIPAETAPAGPPDAGKRVIVDQGDRGKVAGTVSGYTVDPATGKEEALVRTDAGEVQVPLSALAISAMTPKEIAAEDASRNPPVKRDAPKGPDIRRVGKANIKMPDDLHARLYDLGKMREENKRMLGVSQLDLDRTSAAEQAKLAKAFSLGERELGQIADDYRYRVDRTARSANSELPITMRPVNPTLLDRKRSESAREAKKAEAATGDAISPEKSKPAISEVSAEKPQAETPAEPAPSQEARKDDAKPEPVKWFGARSRAQKYIENAGLKKTHRVVEAKRAEGMSPRFEVRPKAPVSEAPTAQIRAANGSNQDSQRLKSGQLTAQSETAPSAEQSAPPQEAGPRETVEPAKAEQQFSGNTIFTADKVEAARARLRAKLSQLNSGIDPEILMDGMTIAGAYIESGVRSFGDYARRMADDFGPKVKPYLLSFWEGARHFPGVDNAGMTSPEESKALHADIMAEKPPVSGARASDGVKQGDRNAAESRNADDANPDAANASPRNEGEVAPNVQGDEAGGDARTVPPADRDRADGPSLGGEGGAVRRGERPEEPALRQDISGAARQSVDGDQVAGGSGAARGDRGSGIAGRGEAAGRPVAENQEADLRPDRRDEPGRSGEDGVRGGAEQAARDTRGAQLPVSAVGRNFRIAPGAIERTGSWRDTAERNVAIVELVKTLESEGRRPTPDEAALLTRFTGWGASEIANNVFGDRNGQFKPGWEGIGQRLKAALTPEEYAQARRTTQYAHYTGENVIRPIYTALERMGFTGGRVLEPGMGIGLFNGLMPAGMAANSRYTGVEYDTITGAIAKLLYPQSDVIVGDYTKTALPKDYFDLAIGNPPFSSAVVSNDPEYKKNGFMLHDYFFAKTIDRVKPGGLLVFVTSKGTMDKANDVARRYLAARANLVGAIRLPQTAFKDNAGTEVVTDIIFLQKRGEGIANNGVAWKSLGEVDTAQEKTLINEYFVAHPEMVLGSHAMTGSMYRANTYTVEPKAGSSIEMQLSEAVTNLPEGIVRTGASAAAPLDAAAVQRDYNPKVRKEGGVYVGDDGALMQVENGSGTPLTTRTTSSNKIVPLKDGEIALLKDWVGVRDALKTAYKDQLADGDWQTSLAALRKTYEGFVARHGRLREFTTIERRDEDGNVTVSKRFKNDPLFRLDIEGVLAHTLEKINEEAGTIAPDRVLTDRVLEKRREPQITTVQDALFVSLDGKGRLDLDHVASLAGLSREEAVSSLGAEIYEDPSGEWQTADKYTSGNVRAKLRDAQAAAALDKRFSRNVEALLAVQPRPLGPSEISVNLGQNWIEPGYVADFASEVMGEKMVVRYSEKIARWTVDTGSGRSFGEYNTPKMSGAKILDAVLNNREIKITEKDSEGKSHVDPVATEAAMAMAAKMRESFRSWVWTDKARANKLVSFYNENFNNIAPRKFDGSHLTLPGVTSRIDLHPHQKRAIWRIVQEGDTYLAHAVGAGKTNEMIAAGMEERRLGLSKKPMYVVPNHMLSQFSREFLELYPAANIMVADEQNFHTDNRRRFVAQAALNDPDAIILTHSAFGRLAMSEDYTASFIQDKITEWEDAKQDVDKSDRLTLKQIERQIEQLERRLEAKAGDASKKDKALTFEELGVDRLFVDECFTYGTLVETDIGTLPIGEIVEKRLAVSVKSLNPETHAIEWKPVTNWYAHARRTKLIEVFHESGSFICTPNHNIYTLRGYVKAGELRDGDELLAVRQGVFSELHREAREEDAVLLRGMFHGSNNRHEAVRTLPEGIFVPDKRGDQQRETPFLLDTVPVESAGDGQIIHGRMEEKDARDLGGLPPQGKKFATLIGSNAQEQPNALPGSEAESQRQLEGNLAPSASARRKRAFDGTANAAGDADGYAAGVRGEYETDQGAVGAPAEALQNRRGRPDKEDRYRGGWKLAQSHQSAAARQEEGCSPAASRVVGLEVLEPGSDGEYRFGGHAHSVVYDIEVADHHNYLANGIVVSNSHEYRKLDFATNQGRIKGIDPAGSQRAMDLEMKVQYLRKKNGKRTLVMASGTPVTNTMGELFTVQRFFQPAQLAEDGHSSFDAWASHYGAVASGFEQNAAGGYEIVARFAKFQNVPELMSRVRSFMDILTSSDLGALVKRPKVKGGGREIAVTEVPDGYKEYQQELQRRITAIRMRNGRPMKGADIILNVIGDGRFSAIDMRFVDPLRPSDPKSKLNRVIDDVISAYRDTADRVYSTDGKEDPIKGSSILLFSDIGLGEDAAEKRGFDMRGWIEQRLTAAGIPADHIAFRRDFDTHAKKERLNADMREGRKRILIGGKNMETGLNVQKRLAWLGHVDAPWFPASVEQREGRIIRQGNQNDEVAIKAYATKGSYDSTMWGMNARKARFIEQAMSGDASVRSLEDVSEASAFEVAAALASGDERYMKLAGLKSDIGRLERLASAHHDQQRRLSSSKHALEQQIDSDGKAVAALEDAIRNRKPVQAGAFEAKAGDRTYTSRDEFSDALFKRFSDLAGKSETTKEGIKVGEIGNFPILFHASELSGSYRASMAVGVPNLGRNEAILSYPLDPATAVAGIATRAANQVNGLDAQLARAKGSITENQGKVRQIDQQLGAPFPEQAVLIEKFGEMQELQAELAREKSQDAEAVTEAAAATVEIDPSPAISDEAQRPARKYSIAPQPDSIPTRVENIANGKAALERLLSSRDTAGIPQWHAMHRHRVGWISFLWEAGPRGELGIGHLMEGRADQGKNAAYGNARLTGKALTDFIKEAIPSIIVDGQMGRWYQVGGYVRRNLYSGKGTVVLQPVVETAGGTVRINFLATAFPGKGKEMPVAATPVSDAEATKRIEAMIADAKGRGSRPYSMATQQRPSADGTPSTREGPSAVLTESDLGRAGSGDGVSIPEAGRNGKQVRDELSVHSLGSVAQRMIDAGRVKVIDTAPADVPKGAQGWTAPDGTITLVAGAIPEGRAMAVLLHEAFHAGARPLIGEAAWDRLMADLNPVYRQMKGGSGPARVFFDRARESVRNAGVTGETLSVEEFAAYAIENAEAAPRSLRLWIDKAVGHVKAWMLRTFGKQVGAVTVGELRAIAAQAMRDSREGMPPASGTAKYSMVSSASDAAKQIKGKLTDLTPAMLAAIPLNYFAELKRPSMTAVDTYLGVKRAMDTYRGKKQEMADKLSQEWLSYNRLGIGKEGKAKAAELAGLMHDSTLAGIDPSLKSAPDGDEAAAARYEQLRERYMALPPKGRELFNAARDAYKAQSEEMDRIILDNVKRAMEIAAAEAQKGYLKEVERIQNSKTMSDLDKAMALDEAQKARSAAMQRSEWANKARMTRLRSEFESSRLQGPYFPLARFGRYFVLLKDIDGEVLSFQRFEQAADMTSALAEMKAVQERNYPGATVESGVLDEPGSLRDAMDPRMVAQIETILGGASVDPAIMDSIWQRYLQTLPEMSIRKRQIRRKGTAGFEKDALRVFANHMFHASHQMARMKYGLDLQEALNKSAEQARASDDPVRGSTIVNEMRKRHEWVMNPTGSQFATKVTSAMFVWYLGASPSSAIVNLTQTVIVGLPVLGARLGGIPKAAAAVTRAAGDFIAGKGRAENSSRLSPDEKDAMAAFYESGLIDRTRSHDLAGIGNTGSEYSALQSRIMAKLSWMFHQAEVFNREVTALAAYRLARAQGEGYQQAVNTAHDVTWKTHFDYCVDDQTECLTTRGWKRWNQLVMGDTAISTDADGNAVETAITAINVFRGDKKLRLYKNGRNFSMAATDNHRCIIQRQVKQRGKGLVWAKPEPIEALGLKRSHFLLRAPLGAISGRESTIGVEMAALLGWVAAEGWYARNRGAKAKNNVRIEQSLIHNPQHVDEIERVLDALGGHYSRHSVKNGRHVLWSLTEPLASQVRAWMPDNKLTWGMVATMSAEELTACLDAFNCGDGSARGKNGCTTIGQKASTNWQNLDVLQAMATMLGKTASIGSETTNDRAYLMIAGTGHNKTQRTMVGNLRVSEMKTSMVWCPTTENSRWIARRNGCVFVTGNSNSNRPRILQSDAAKVALVFQNFQINMWYRFFRDFHQSIKGETPAARREARYQLAGIMGMLTLMGGVTGIFGFKVLMALAGMFLDDKDDPRGFEEEIRGHVMKHFGPDIGGMILKGIPGTLLNIDISSRVGMADFFIRTRDTNKEGRDAGLEWLAALFGATASTALNVYDGAQMIGKGEVYRGAEIMFPKVIKDLMQAYRFQNDGIETRKGNTVLERDRLTAWDILAKASGFTSGRISETYERNRELGNAERKVQDERKQLVAAWAKARMDNDDEDRKAAMEKIVEFNARPYARGTIRITPETLNQSLQVRRRNDQKREDGVLIENRELNRFLRSSMPERVFQ